MTQSFASIWDAIEDTPGDAAVMKLRSTLMMALVGKIKSQNMSLSDAAKVFGVTQKRISDLLHGKINAFELDSLVSMAATAGLDIKLNIT